MLTPEDIDPVEEGASLVVGSSNEPEKADPPAQGSPLLGTPDLSRKQEGSEETVVLTLAQIKEFIETGRTDQLPNNKVIPGGLNVRDNVDLTHLSSNFEFTYLGYISSRKQPPPNPWHHHARNRGR